MAGSTTPTTQVIGLVVLLLLLAVILGLSLTLLFHPVTSPFNASTLPVASSPPTLPRAPDPPELPKTLPPQDRVNAYKELASAYQTEAATYRDLITTQSTLYKEMTANDKDLKSVAYLRAASLFDSAVVKTLAYLLNAIITVALVTLLGRPVAQAGLALATAVSSRAEAQRLQAETARIQATTEQLRTQAQVQPPGG